MNSVAFTLSLLLVAEVGWSQEEDRSLCIPTCTGASEGDKTKDPTNCLRYYYCSDPDGGGVLYPSLEPFSCPDGQYFNSAATVMECEVIIPGSDYCTGLCSPCEVTCQGPGTLVPHPFDCNAYYVCLDGPDPLINFCPEPNVYFDFASGLCISDPTYCYDYCDPCATYCATEGKVPNPSDCTGYYYCDPPNLSPLLV
ncbi:hypothetical protein Pmani_013628 [Petrolisthes manimaculis]|uniref:Chitin-binding type-2 domain-containing protein n=1 Tax=Petrolisthes manimaculis TaxID=1843537 RepID=A0AAE1PUS7_9EUCA|nr:hypothetical protein Pmani_013628 [Petrolisthes manimaculis]